MPAPELDSRIKRSGGMKAGEFQE